MLPEHRFQGGSDLQAWLIWESSRHVEIGDPNTATAAAQQRVENLRGQAQTILQSCGGGQADTREGLIDSIVHIYQQTFGTGSLSEVEQELLQLVSFQAHQFSDFPPDRRGFVIPAKARKDCHLLGSDFDTFWARFLEAVSVRMMSLTFEEEYTAAHGNWLVDLVDGRFLAALAVGACSIGAGDPASGTFPVGPAMPFEEAACKALVVTARTCAAAASTSLRGTFHQGLIDTPYLRRILPRAVIEQYGGGDLPPPPPSSRAEPETESRSPTNAIETSIDVDLGGQPMSRVESVASEWDSSDSDASSCDELDDLGAKLVRTSVIDAVTMNEVIDQDAAGLNANAPLVLEVDGDVSPFKAVAVEDTIEKDEATLPTTINHGATSVPTDFNEVSTAENTTDARSSDAIPSLVLNEHWASRRFLRPQDERDHMFGRKELLGTDGKLHPPRTEQQILRTRQRGAAFQTRQAQSLAGGMIERYTVHPGSTAGSTAAPRDPAKLMITKIGTEVKSLEKDVDKAIAAKIDKKATKANEENSSRTLEITLAKLPALAERLSTVIVRPQDSAVAEHRDDIKTRVLALMKTCLRPYIASKVAEMNALDVGNASIGQHISMLVQVTKTLDSTNKLIYQSFGSSEEEADQHCKKLLKRVHTEGIVKALCRVGLTREAQFYAEFYCLHAKDSSDGTHTVVPSTAAAAAELQLNHMPADLGRPIGVRDYRVKSIRNFTPDPWQAELLDAVDQRKSALVSAPTSVGKTFSCYYAMQKVLEDAAYNDGVIVYVCPTKALVNQVKAEIEARFEKGYSGKDQRTAKQKKTSRKTLVGVFTADFRIAESTCTMLCIFDLTLRLRCYWIPRQLD
jgi:hypothetical protein